MGVELGLSRSHIHRLRTFENRLLRRIFGPKRKELAADWRRLLNEKLHNLTASSNIIRVIKSRNMRFAGHVERMGHDKRIQHFGWRT
jgi:hypothetical protein